MSRPTLSLVVPTHREDRPLARCLNSVRGQLQRCDEVIVVGDVFDGPLPKVERLVKSLGRHFRYLAIDGGGHDWGHTQLNAGIAQARGDYIHVNDDDDVWAPDALKLFRACAEAVDEPTPFLFRFRHYNGCHYWARRGLLQRDTIGGHCLLAPNIPGRLGAFTSDYNGDFDWIEGTVSHYGGPEAAVWREEIVAVARP